MNEHPIDIQLARAPHVGRRQGQVALKSEVAWAQHRDDKAQRPRAGLRIRIHNLQLSYTVCTPGRVVRPVGSRETQHTHNELRSYSVVARAVSE